MRTASDSLHRLVRSLTKSEKRDFILFASRYSGSKVYIKLFREISAQKLYNEKALIAKLAGEKVNNYFYSAKAYLFNLILQSLGGKAAGVSPEMRVSTLIKDAEILSSRGLYNDAAKNLKKAAEKALQLEADDILLQVYRAADELNSMDKLEPGPRVISKMIQQKDLAVARLNNTLEMEKLLVEYEDRKSRFGRIRKPEQVTAVKNILQNALARRKSPVSKRAEYIYLHLLSEYEFLQKNEKAGVEILKKQVSLLTGNKEIFSRYKFSYFISRLNYVNRCVQSGFFSEAFEAISSIRAEEKELPVSLAPVIILYSGIFSLIISGHQNSSTETAALLEEHENNYELYKNALRVTDRIDAIFVAAWFNFMLGRYEKALEWTNIPLTKKEITVREDIYKLTKILNIMAHYELASYDTIHYILRNTRYYLNKKSILYKFEAALLEMFGRLINADKKEAADIFAFYRRKLKEISKSRFEQPLSNALFPLLFRWFDSKIV
jgi:hypothetical protein